MARSRTFVSSLVILLAFVGSGCDRFWHLSAGANVPGPLSAECVAGTLRKVEGVDSVWVRRYTPDTSRVQSIDFLMWSTRRYGSLTASQDRSNDSLRLQMSATWVGGKPPSDTIEARARVFSSVLEGVGRSCWGTAVAVNIEWPR